MFFSNILIPIMAGGIMCRVTVWHFIAFNDHDTKQNCWRQAKPNLSIKNFHENYNWNLSRKMLFSTFWRCSKLEVSYVEPSNTWKVICYPICHEIYESTNQTKTNKSCLFTFMSHRVYMGYQKANPQEEPSSFIMECSKTIGRLFGSKETHTVCFILKI